MTGHEYRLLSVDTNVLPNSYRVVGKLPPHRFREVTLGPCHFGMARTRVADGGDGLRILRVSVILQLGVGRGG